jgi:hypothetical protein
MDFPKFSHDIRVSVILVARLLLSSAAQKLCICEQGVFIREHYFASKPSADVCEAFINAYSGQDLRNKNTRLLSPVKLEILLKLVLYFIWNTLYYVWYK